MTTFKLHRILADTQKLQTFSSTTYSQTSTTAFRQSDDNVDKKKINRWPMLSKPAAHSLVAAQFHWSGHVMTVKIRTRPQERTKMRNIRSQNKGNYTDKSQASEFHGRKRDCVVLIVESSEIGRICWSWRARKKKTQKMLVNKEPSWEAAKKMAKYQQN